MTTPTTAAYLYCVVRTAKRPAMSRVPAGVPGASGPEAHSMGPSLWLIVSLVPLDVYGAAALEPRLRDLDWVSQAAVAHEAVVDHLARARGATVIPMKLFTLFSSVDRASAALAARRRNIIQTMRRIAGAEEWGIRVFRRPGTVASDATAHAKAVSGAEFLRARQRARSAAAGARAAAAGAANVAFDRLRRIARDARVRELRHEPGTNPPILDAAFLVPSASRARFKAEARRQARAIDADGGDLMLTGPWPAYNFVTAEEP